MRLPCHSRLAIWSTADDAYRENASVIPFSASHLVRARSGDRHVLMGAIRFASTIQGSRVQAEVQFAII
jgi:hypothetical protein